MSPPSSATVETGAKAGGAEGGGEAPVAGSGGAYERADQEKAKEPAFRPHPHHDSGGGAEQFETRGGDNSIEGFGGEASGAEFEEAAAALHGYLDARAERAWGAACRYLADGITEALSAQLGEARGDGGPSCAELLTGLSGGVPDAVLREASVADVGALRAEGERGFILFHGAGNTDYFIPMVREDGHWKVAGIAPSAAL